MAARLYWVTFRIEKKIGNYDARWKALEGAVSDCANGQWWKEPTSFILFESDLGIGAIASRLKKAIDTDHDVALIGMPDFKGGRVIGKVKDPDLFDLWEAVQAA